MDRKLKAKFICQSVTRTAGPTEHVELQAVISANDDANASWSKWTPAGSLTMTITNPGAQGIFEPGACYYLHIEPAPAT